MDFQRAAAPHCVGQIHAAEVLHGMACTFSSVDRQQYKGPPVICTILIVKDLDEGTISGRSFYDANDMFNMEWTALNPLTFDHELEWGMRELHSIITISSLLIKHINILFAGQKCVIRQEMQHQ